MAISQGARYETKAAINSLLVYILVICVWLCNRIARSWKNYLGLPLTLIVDQNIITHSVTLEITSALHPFPAVFVPKYGMIINSERPIFGSRWF